MSAKLRPGYFRYSRNSYYAIAKIILPAPGNPNGDGPFPVVIYCHGGATSDTGYDRIDGWLDNIYTAELLLRGYAVCAYTHRPGGYYVIADGTSGYNAAMGYGGKEIFQAQMFERAAFPNNLIHHAQIIQYLKSHARDENLLGVGKSLHTDERFYARVGNSSGAWSSGYVNYMPDGSFPYNPSAVSNAGEYRYRFNHCAQVFVDWGNTRTGGQITLSQFNNIAYIEGVTTATADYGEYSWAGGYIYDSNMVRAGVTWDNLEMDLKIAADYDTLIVAENPRVAAVRTLSFNTYDYDIVPMADTFGLTWTQMQTALLNSNVMSRWTPGVQDDYYVDLHAPKNQYWLHTQLRSILGSSYHGQLAAGRALGALPGGSPFGTNDIPGTTGYGLTDPQKISLMCDFIDNNIG